MQATAGVQCGMPLAKAKQIAIQGLQHITTVELGLEVEALCPRATRAAKMVINLQTV
jgi:hypothetical protein